MRVTRRTALGVLAGAAAAPLLAQRGRELEVPYVPTPPELVEKMLDLAAVGPEDHLIDLGCGDGRIAVAAGRRGARALGVDLNDRLIQRAGAAARAADLQNRVWFRRQDLFETPLHEASVVTLYLLPAVNLRLRPRLLTELRPGARVVSHAFDMGDWEPDATETLDGRRAMLWHVPAVAGGSWDLTEADGGYALIELEQRFQSVAGTLMRGGAAIPVTGRLRGPALTLEGAGFRLAGRIEDDAIVPADAGAGWRATRSG